MNQFKYILTVLPLMMLQAVWAQNLYEEYISHTDATTTWQNGHYERVARELYKMPKGYRFTANDNKSLRAHIDETLLFDADYLTSESDIPNIDEYELDQSRPVGVIPSSHGVSPTGAAVYNIPIEVAPGTRGMQPSLSVAYSSQAGNGILGMGWSLNGMMAVTRCNPSVYFDGNTNDGEGSRFMLNGQRLLLWTGNKYGDPGSTYETEARSFAEIKAGNKGPHIQSFTVKTKDGMIYYYGTEDSDMDNHSKIEVTDGAPDEKVFAWLLRKVIDKNGNYITYHYHEDNHRGEFWLEEIKYTGNDFAGVAPYNSVKFFYENRKDKNTTYFLGKHEQSVLLRQVKVEAEGQLAWYYDFTYQYSNSSICSRLVQVDKKDRNGNQMNPIKIEWGSSMIDFDTETTISTVFENSHNMHSADFNGDGLTDLYSFPTYENGESGGNICFYINKGDNTFDKKTWPVSSSYSHRLIVTQGRFQKDPTDQLIVGWNYPNNGYPFSDFRYLKLNNAGEIISDNDRFITINNSVDELFPIDYNGDGVQELLVKEARGYSIIDYQNIKVHYIDGLPIPHTNTYPLDIDGDGGSEIMIKLNKDIGFTEHSFFIKFKLDQSTQKIVPITLEIDGVVPSIWHEVFTADFNGDRKTDLLTYSPSGWHISYSSGTGFKEKDAPIPDDIGSPEEDPKINNILCADYNGDGRTDILRYVIQKNTSGDPYINARSYYDIYYSTGDSFIQKRASANHAGIFDNSKIEYTDISNTPFPFWNQKTVCKNAIGDFNLDGKVDILMPYLGKQKFLTINYCRTEYYIAKIHDGIETVEYNFHGGQQNPEMPAFIDEEEQIYSLGYIPLRTVHVMHDIKGFYFHEYSKPIIHTLKGFLGFESTKMTFSYDYTNEKFVTVATNGLNSEFGFLYPLTSKTSAEAGTYVSIAEKDINKYHTVAGTTMNSSLNSRVYYSYPKVISQTIDGFTTVTIAQQTDNGNPHMIDVRKGSESGTLISRKSWVWESEPLGSLNKLQSYGEASFADGNIAAITKDYTYSAGDISSVTHTTITNGDAEDGELSVEVFETDYFGNRTKTTKNGRETIYGFDQFGRWPLTVTDFRNETATFTYDPRWGAKTSETDSWGYTTQYTYTGFGSLIKEMLPTGLEIKHSSHWDINSATDGKGMYWSKTENPDGSYSQTWYDHSGRKIRSSSNGLVFVDKKYSDSGTEIEQSLPYRQGGSPLWAKTTVDARNRPLSVFNGISTTTYNYTDGASGTTVTINDSSKDYSITKKFNELGQLESVTDLGGTITYDYNIFGALKSTKLHNATTSFKYDKYGNRTEINDPSAGISTSVYNEWGDLLEQTTATGTTTYTYDDLGYLQTVSENGSTSTYSYNSKKLVENISNSNGTSKAYSYNQWGQVLKEITTVGNRSDEHSYSYDDKGRVQIESYGNRFHLAYEYDNIGRLTSLRNNSNGKLIYQTGKQIPISNITTETRGSSQMVVKKRYDDYGRLVHIYDDQDFRVDYKYSFWDGTNNLKTFEDRRRPTGYMSYLGESYQYSNDRLTKYSSLAGTADYDEKGNMVYNPFIDATPEETPDIFDENMVYQNFVTKPYQLTSMEVSRTDFDLPAHEVAFNEIGLAESITENGYEISFLYGSDHQRAKMDIKKNGTPFMTKYYFGPTELQIDKDGNERTIDYIGIGDGLLAMYVTHPEGEGDPEIIHCVTDRLGSPYKLFKDDGTQLAEYSYDPWGRMRNPSTLQAYKPGEITWASLEENGYPSWFHRGYTGHEMLFGVNLINMNARLYDPITCRFLSPDNYVQTPEFSQNYNRYAYCLNNPLSSTDPTGNFFFIMPTFGVSSSGGPSFGITFGIGTPNFGIGITLGYSPQSNSTSISLGANFGFVGASIGYGNHAGFSAYAGVSFALGDGFGTNITTAGIGWSQNGGAYCNFSAFTCSRNGISFNPSASFSYSFSPSQGYKFEDVAYMLDEVMVSGRRINLWHGASPSYMSWFYNNIGYLALDETIGFQVANYKMKVVVYAYNVPHYSEDLTIVGSHREVEVSAISNVTLTTEKITPSGEASLIIDGKVMAIKSLINTGKDVLAEGCYIGSARFRVPTSGNIQINFTGGWNANGSGGGGVPVRYPPYLQIPMNKPYHTFQL